MSLHYSFIAIAFYRNPAQSAAQGIDRRFTRLNENQMSHRHFEWIDPIRTEHLDIRIYMFCRLSCSSLPNILHNRLQRLSSDRGDASAGLQILIPIRYYCNIVSPNNVKPQWH